MLPATTIEMAGASIGMPTNQSNITANTAATAAPVLTAAANPTQPATEQTFESTDG